MKTKLFNRVTSLVLACIMLFAISTTAFAAEKMVTTPTITSVKVTAMVTVPGNSTRNLTVPLSTSGSGKVFWIVTNAPHHTSSVKLRFHLYDSVGNEVSYGDWVLGINDQHDYSIAEWLTKGDYRLNIENNYSSSVEVYAGWY